MMGTNSQLKASYLQANIKAKFRNLKVAFAVALAIFPTALLIDIVNDYDNIMTYIIVRIAAVFIIIGLYIVYFFQKDERHFRIIEYCLIVFIMLFLSGLSLLTGGVSSPHIAGFSLLLFGATFVLSQRLTDTLITVTLVVSFYIIIYILSDRSNPLVISDFFTNLYFIISTSALALTFSYFSEKWRINQFELRYMLKEKNIKLSEMSKIKSNLLDNVSHDFRHPVTLIKAASDDLVIADCPLKNREKVFAIKKSSDQLLHLVSDILDISKLEKGQALELEPLNIIVTVKSSINAMQYLAESQKIKLSYEGPTTPIIVNGSFHALEKIFTNLLSNALKFTPEGGVIHFKIKQLGESISVSIIDNGIGIPEDDLQYIFERFVQVKSTIALTKIGSGLGLALVKDFTEIMQGTINVTSEEGYGSVFTVTFPCSEETNSQDVEKIIFSEKSIDWVQKKKEASHASDKTKPSLLIVEDDDYLLQYLTKSLEADYQVLQAVDGDSAMVLIRAHQPDIVLADWMLPSSSGVQLCEKIKGNVEWQSTKVVILTARVDEKSEMTALEAGADDFIIKPFSKAVLKTRLHNLYQNLILEREMHAKNNELNETITTLKNIKMQLIHSEKINAIGSLASGLLHEINNPLNYALTAIQLLERDTSLAEQGEQSEMVADIYDGMLRIKQIVQDLRSFAHPDAASKERPFKLKKAVQSAIRFSVNGLYGIDVKVVIDDSLVVLGSQSHIIQVMINLLSNAARALENQNNRKIDITADLVANSKVRICFRDNGFGINKETLSRIFEPFFTTKEVGEGLGMGLSISYTIIENHNSLLKVASELGEYTEFQFDLMMANT